CGLASWSRDEWLTHKGMLEHAARWVAGRLKARGLANRRLTTGQVAAKSAAGYIDHWTYTKATGDGTHWDVGDGFPWDYFGARVTANLIGNKQEDDMAGLTDEDVQKVAKAVVAELAKGKGYATHTDIVTVLRGPSEPNSLDKLGATLGRIETAVTAPPAEPPAAT
ncbi:MAG TPA: hypothetical protein VF506_06415, partial [Streptosporangiaceae bacterium]